MLKIWNENICLCNIFKHNLYILRKWVYLIYYFWKIVNCLRKIVHLIFYLKFTQLGSEALKDPDINVRLFLLLLNCLLLKGKNWLFFFSWIFQESDHNRIWVDFYVSLMIKIIPKRHHCDFNWPSILKKMACPIHYITL